jgi:hypothetical protein
MNRFVVLRLRSPRLKRLTSGKSLFDVLSHAAEIDR